MTKRASIIQSLEGTTLMIPDLEAMLAHWPSAVNVHKEKLETEVHARLEKYGQSFIQSLKLIEFEKLNLIKIVSRRAAIKKNEACRRRAFRVNVVAIRDIQKPSHSNASVYMVVCMGRWYRLLRTVYEPF